MKKVFRYLLLFNLPNYSISLGVAAVILIGCCATGIPQTGRGFFSGYFMMFPSCLLMVALFSGQAYCTSSLNHALSYGARRKDYFWGTQLVILFNSLVYSAMTAVFLSLPSLLNWSPDFTGPTFSFSYMLSQFAAHAAGCVAGMLYVRSRWLAGLLSGLCSFLLLLSPIFTTITAHTGNLWGDLPWIIPLLYIVVTVLCHFGSYRAIKTAVVR